MAFDGNTVKPYRKNFVLVEIKSLLEKSVLMPVKEAEKGMFPPSFFEERKIISIV